MQGAWGQGIRVCVSLPGGKVAWIVASIMSV
jgi:hypothetical protein